MTEKFKDFIGVWKNVVPADYCNMLINNFKDVEHIQSTLINTKEKSTTISRHDHSYVLNYHNEHAYFVYECIGTAFKEYVTEYQQLSELNLFPSEIKIQKTPPGGGYHTWHYENAGWEVSQRELAWMIYLNDIPDGEGETEFLYQKTRIKPTQGTVVIWPAGMTHVHRGNTMFTCDKYILTGWFIKLPTR